MKTVECIRCHKMIRLDEYRDHLSACAGAEPVTKAPETPQPQPQTQPQPQPQP